MALQDELALDSLLREKTEMKEREAQTESAELPFAAQANRRKPSRLNIRRQNRRKRAA